ncbi:MAG TPA: hypothetical protein VMW73_05850 [Spirochaetia bacterium]|nr:hypothetical protein [Spirochaetia bacterium]
MPAVASLDDLKAVEEELKRLNELHPEAYGLFSAFFKKFRNVGYKNIVKLMLGETTPEKLKGEG